MRAGTFIGQIIAVLSRRATAFALDTANPATLPGRPQALPDRNTRPRPVIKESRAQFKGMTRSTDRQESKLRWLSGALVVVVCVVGVVVDLAWVAVGSHIPWFSTWTDSHGIAAIVAIATAVAGAPVVYRTGRGMLRPILFISAITASIVITIKLPATLSQSFGGLRQILQIALAVVLVYLIAKLTLLHRFSAFHGAQVARSSEDLAGLLPFQEQDLETLKDAVLTGRVNDGARVVQFCGRWGEGKSYLLERFDRYMEDNSVEGADPCAVILINVWEQQSEPDLHLAIVEQILGHQRYWYPYGWLRYPLSLNLARLTKEVKLAVSTKSTVNAKIEFPVSLPRPTGKSSLERLVARVRGKGFRTVVVLDEIDRAAPQIAQAAVTFAVRSLNIPGMVVVLSYVEEVMLYKAFNPLVDCLPDLGSTMRAVIFAAGPDRGGIDTPGGVLSEAREGSLAKWDAWSKADTIALPGGGSSTAGGSEGQRPPTDQDSRRLSDAVRLAFAYADRHQRLRLQRRFAEKFLGSRPIKLQRLQPDDVATIVVSFDSLSGSVNRLMGDDGSRVDLVGQAIEDAFRFYQEDFPIPEMPPLRVLEGELYTRLSGIHPGIHPGIHRQPVSPQFIAAVTLAAFDAATLHDL